jgi:hypothetical protein
MRNMRMWDDVHCLCNLSIFVLELGIRWSLSRKCTLGTLNFHQPVPRIAHPTSSSLSETVQVEVLRVAYVEETTPGALVWEKMVEAPTLMGEAGANMSLRANGDRVNGVEPRPKDVPGRATLIPRTSKGPGFSPSWETALDDVTSVPRSFDIVDLGIGEPGLPGYPWAHFFPPAGGKWRGGRGVQS